MGKDNYGIYSTSRITLAWTNYSDTITSNGIYVQGSYSDNGKYFYLNDTQTQAQWTEISDSHQYSINDYSNSFTLKPAGDKTVTFNMNGGNEENYSFNIAHNGTITEPVTPTRDGCIFDGWYVNNEKCTFPYTVTDNITLTAKWKVPYLTADGTTAHINAENVTDITTNTSELSNGWYKVTNNIEISNNITASGNVDLIICYGVAFSVSQITGSANLTIYTQDTSSVMSVSNGISVNTVTVNGGTINAENINGNSINISLTNKNDSVTASYNGNVTLNGTYASTKNNQLAYAYWNSAKDNNINGATLTLSNKCTVTFNSNGGSAVTSQTIVEGMRISQPENPTKNKSVFAGWFINGQKYDFDTVYDTFTTDTITLTAKWIPFAEYLDENGQLIEKADAQELSSDSYVWGEWGEENWYAVNETLNINQRVTVYGNVNLILRNGATLNALEGIDVNTPASLTVYVASTEESTMGVLNSTGLLMYYNADSYMSDIGGYYNGTVTINGGKIYAKGGKGGVGIGGNYYSG